MARIGNVLGLLVIGAGVLFLVCWVAGMEEATGIAPPGSPADDYGSSLPRNRWMKYENQAEYANPAQLEPHAIQNHGLDAVEIYDNVKTGECVPQEYECIDPVTGASLGKVYLRCESMRPGIDGLVVMYWRTLTGGYHARTAYYIDSSSDGNMHCQDVGGVLQPAR